MRIAYRAETLIDAHLVKDALESADIPAFVAGEYLTGAVGNLPALDYVAVLVPEASLPAAMAVVREVERELIDARLALDEQYGEEQAGDDAPSFMPA
jgi:hypothetical protein